MRNAELFTVQPEASPEESVAARRQKLLEVSGLVAQGMALADAASLVVVNVDADTELPQQTFQHCFTPTPEQIIAACAAIRAGWTTIERRNRLVAVDSQPWSIPRINDSENLGAA